jgi:thiamine-phosphate pyrophosphorylase
MYDTSPAVERVAEAARQAGAGRPTLADWLLALLDDDMGRPAALLERAGLDLDTVRQAAVELQPPLAPDSTRLFSTARELGIRLKADPALTTDLVFAAVLLADSDFTAGLSSSGLVLDTLLGLMRTAELEGGADFAGSDFVIPDPPEQLAAARIVDVNLNRSREALRAIDDYCRFVLDDRGLTERVKKLRHQLAEASARLPQGLLLTARDTPNDVGTVIGTQREYARTTPAEVATVNVKRLQEALRSLEEYGKVLDAGFAKAVEAIRYETYTVERELVRGADARSRLAEAKLYVLLTGSQCVTAMDWLIQQAAEGGADVFQLREKELTDRELIARARQVRVWTRKAGVLFVMNDRSDIARLVQADGVHLGQDDLPVAAARRIVGPDLLIGVSTHTIEQVRQAVRDRADYIGVGPTFPSKTKQFESLAGLQFVREVSEETTLPAFALGGITAGNVAEVVAAGGTRIAVSAAVATASEPRSAAVTLKSVLLAPRAGSSAST